jgi:hypothetical protein
VGEGEEEGEGMSLKRGDVVEIRGATGDSAPFNGLKAIVVDPDRRNKFPLPGRTTVLVLSPEDVSQPDADLGYFSPEWLRKVVVLDLSDRPVPGDRSGRSEARKLVDMLRETADNFFTPNAAGVARRVADQIEAQTQPPRIPEPKVFGVVRAIGRDGIRREWVRTLNGWSDGYSVHPWSTLGDPILVRPGLE